MKLAPILTEYLYQNKRLELPGIGIFRLRQASLSGEEDNKQIMFTGESPISFEANPSLRESPRLIDFISAQTGKMRALAAADLDSHLELVQQFLNIGKPFLFEGIGSVIKTKSGQYEFASGLTENEKIKEYKGKEISLTSSTEDSFTEYNNIFSPKKIKINWQRPAIFGLILIGAGLAVWGGYAISRKRVSQNITAGMPAEKEQKIIPPVDTVTRTAELPKKDSTIIEKPAIQSDKFKFIIEVAKKERGLHRLDMLKGFGLDVQIETKDSVDYKLFFMLPAASKDTARIMDSLRYLYTPYWSKAFVEN